MTPTSTDFADYINRVANGVVEPCERFASKYSEISSSVIQEVDQEFKQYTFVKTFEYPQDSVSLNFEIQLSNAYNAMLKQPFGLMYKVGTIDVPVVDGDQTKVSPVDIYQFGSNRFINCNNTWYLMEPVVWLVNKEIDSAVTQAAFTSKSLPVNAKYIEFDPFETLLNEIRMYGAELSSGEFIVDSSDRIIETVTNINKQFESKKITEEERLEKLTRFRDELKAKYDKRIGNELLSESLDPRYGHKNEIGLLVKSTLERLAQTGNTDLLKKFESYISAESANASKRYVDSHFDTLIDQIENFEETYNRVLANIMRLNKILDNNSMDEDLSFLEVEHLSNETQQQVR